MDATVMPSNTNCLATEEGNLLAIQVLREKKWAIAIPRFRLHRSVGSNWK